MNAKEYFGKTFRTALLSVLLFSPAGLFCEEAVIEYLKGNISDKIHAVQQSSLSGDMSICLRALDFAASCFFSSQKERFRLWIQYSLVNKQRKKNNLFTI